MNTDGALRAISQNVNKSWTHLWSVSNFCDQCDHIQEIHDYTEHFTIIISHIIYLEK
jgi:hypothetical protein